MKVKAIIETVGLVSGIISAAAGVGAECMDYSEKRKKEKNSETSEVSTKG